LKKFIPENAPCHIYGIYNFIKKEKMKSYNIEGIGNGLP
jgi:hypothetical protein